MGALPVLKARLYVVSKGIRAMFGNLHGVLTLALSTIRVNGGAWKPGVEEVIIEEIGSPLVIYENHCTSGRHSQ